MTTLDKKTTSNKAIGVFDSGVGGLSVLRHLVELMPSEKFIYLGDTARVPYGNKSPETVQKYSQQCAQFLIDHNVKMVVIACNTASALALHEVGEVSNVPVSGVIIPAVEAALNATRNGRIGVIATRATISSNAYADTILKRSQNFIRYDYNIELHNNAFKNGGEIPESAFPFKNKKIEIFSQACPLFVPLVEEGMAQHPSTRLIAREYLAPLQSAEIDTLILGCTHYPVLADLLADLMPDVTLVDSGEQTAIAVQNILKKQNSLSGSEPTAEHFKNIEFYATDTPPTFATVAENILGFRVETLEMVNVDQREEKTV
ncbi:MAG: glutamate racemase [Bacteroidota bacterium]